MPVQECRNSGHCDCAPADCFSAVSDTRTCSTWAAWASEVATFRLHFCTPVWLVRQSTGFTDAWMVPMLTVWPQDGHEHHEAQYLSGEHGEG